jgi:tetratricopeptide (TPR) repeat protein
MAKKPKGPESLDELAGELEALLGQLSPEDAKTLKQNMEQLLQKGSLWDNEEEADLDVAQALIYDAWEEPRVDKRVAIAKDAIATSNCCSDGYLILANDLAKSAKERLSYIQEAVVAGERAIKVLKLEEAQGQYWGLIETRPYMRALNELGLELQKTGLPDEAIAIYERMIKLNPDDNQGIRYILLELYLRKRDTKHAHLLISQFEDDASAFFAYNKTLLVFLTNGKSVEAQTLLKEAMNFNPHVVKYLVGKKKLPINLPEAYQMGKDDEAQLYAAEGLGTWSAVPNAIDWLKEELTDKALS